MALKISHGRWGKTTPNIFETGDLGLQKSFPPTMALRVMTY